LTAADGSGAASLPPAATLSQLGIGGLLVTGYLVVTRIGSIQVAKIGIELGPVPLFLTELFILALLGTVLVTRARLFIGWLLTGSTAGWPGLSLWLLLIASVVYCLAAVGTWGILAVRDLAIFGYGVVFPLTYIALDTEEKAAAVMRAFTYSGFILAVLLVGDTASGLHMIFGVEERGVEGAGGVVSWGGGDVGGIIGFSAAALLAYAGACAERRFLHLGMALVCLYAEMIGQTRSAIIGLVLAFFYIFMGVRPMVRLTLLVQGVAGVAAIAAIPLLLPGTAVAHTVEGFWLTLHSASSGAADGNAYFRLLRWDAVLNLWKSEPIFGVGFGRPVIPASLIDLSEVGVFNVGLPHNTYLTVLARLGLFGFILVMIPWFGCIGLGFSMVGRRRFGVDAFAAGAAMTVMIGFAFFVLFLERPLHVASLWALAAIITRLARGGHQAARSSLEPLAHARRVAWQKGYR
jgi:O-antigen ligase